MSRARTAVVAAAILLVLTACTETVSGHPVGLASDATSGFGSTPATSAPTRGHSSVPPANEDSAAFADPAQVREVVADTTADLVATQSYDYRRIPALLSAGTAATTGGFRTEFRTAVVSIIQPNASKVHAVQTATVRAVGITAGPTEGVAQLAAVVRVTTTNTSHPSGDAVPEAVRLTATEVGRRWLISALTPASTASTTPVPCEPAGTRGLTVACTSAETGTAALSTFDRAHFAAQYEHVQSLTVAPLLQDLQTERAVVQSALTPASPSITTRNLGGGVESTTGDAARVLVVELVTRAGQASQPDFLTVSLLRSGEKWLLADVTTVGVS